jgi:hypothetical protein
VFGFVLGLVAYFEPVRRRGFVALTAGTSGPDKFREITGNGRIDKQREQSS